MTPSRSCLTVFTTVVTLLGLASTDAAAISVGGTLPTSTSWSVQDSPVFVVTDLTVPAGGSLTIHPGVDVQFARGTRLVVNGLLRARGTSAAPILFRSTNPPYIGWRGIAFTDSSVDAVYDQQGAYVDGSILEHVTILGGYATDAIGPPDPAIGITNAFPLVTSARLNGNVSGLNATYTLQQPAGTLKIRHSTFESQEGTAILLNYGQQEVLVENNVINFNASGIRFYAAESGRGTFRNNRIANNRGIALGIENGVGALGALAITDNVIADNMEGVRLWNMGAGQLSLERNQILRNSPLGGLYLSSTAYRQSTHRIADNVMTGNRGLYGAARVTVSGSVEFVRNVVTENSSTATSYSAGYSAGLSLSIYDSLYPAGPSSATVSGNVFADNSALTHSGLYVRRMGTSTLTVTTNTITRNRVFAGAPPVPTAVVGVEGGVTLSGNNIFGNTTPYLLESIAGTEAVTASNNWWGTANPRLIDAIVLDARDEATRPPATVAPALSSIATAPPLSPPSDFHVVSVNGTWVLSWRANPESDVKGYRVWYGPPAQPRTGTGAAQGPSPIDVGLVTTMSLTGLAPGTMVATVTAYDAEATAGQPHTAGHESWFAPEIRQPFTAAGSACVSAFAVDSHRVGALPASGSVQVLTGPDCPWTVTSTVPWLVTTASGTGPGVATYQVQANGTGARRSASLTLNGGHNLGVIQLPAFSDEPLQAGYFVRAAHILELRTRIDARRNTWRLPGYAWTAVTPGAMFRALDIIELREALAHLQIASGQTPTLFTDPDLGPGTVIQAVHINEIRDAVIQVGP